MKRGTTGQIGWVGNGYKRKRGPTKKLSRKAKEEIRQARMVRHQQGNHHHYLGRSDVENN